MLSFYFTLLIYFTPCYVYQTRPGRPTHVQPAVAAAAGRARDASRLEPRYVLFLFYFIHTNETLPPPDPTTTRPDLGG
jgi:hypothetical protein